MSMHPFLYPFGTPERWLSYLTSWFKWPDEQIAISKNLLNRNLIPLMKGSEIADFLGVSAKLVGHMVIKPNRYYRVYSIIKKSGGMRQIAAPRIFLKTIQRYILDCILTPLPIHPAAVGFVRGRTMAMGATFHVGKRFLWNIDLENFFPSINQSRVKIAFEKMGYPSKAAYFLSGLCCLNGALPQGAPTSPALSNYIFAPIDEQINDLAKRNSISYSRYADDLSFSSDNPISKIFQRDVIKIVNENGFNINPSKSRLMGPRCRREVTGLTVNEKISIPREKRRKLRSMFHHLTKNPESFFEKKGYFKGYISWISQYHPDEAARYLKLEERSTER
jgi:RNA-directed DNA polymerase